MSKFELSLPTTNSGRLLTTFFWVWGVLGLAVTYGILQFFPWLAQTFPKLHLPIYGAEIGLFIIGGLAYVYVPFQLSLARVHGQRIVVNDSGFGLPPGFGGVGRSRWIAWSNILSCVLDGRTLRLICRLKAGPSVSVNLNSLAESDREQFLLAFESWAPPAVWTDEIADYSNQLQNELRGIGQMSHGQMFDLELARRFNPPTFVPLDPGMKLRSNTLSVVRQLAFGGFSAVYLADDTLYGSVVLKESVIPDDTSAEAKLKAEELFNREAVFLQRLNHRGIVKIYDHFVEDGRNYLTIEHVPGETMREIVRQRGAQPEMLVIEWCMQVLEVLQHLHCQSPPIVHRDVTPDNIIVSNTGHVMLIDFGASNEYLGSATGTLVGKHSYMPVEQIRGKAEPRSDLFALGATMHFLLTGVDPEPLARSNPSSQKTSISPGLDELVAAATEQDAELRPPTAHDFRRRLQELSSGSDLTSRHAR